MEQIEGMRHRLRYTHSDLLDMRPRYQPAFPDVLREHVDLHLISEQYLEPVTIHPPEESMKDWFLMRNKKYNRRKGSRQQKDSGKNKWGTVERKKRNRPHKNSGHAENDAPNPIHLMNHFSAIQTEEAQPVDENLGWRKEEPKVHQEPKARQWWYKDLRNETHGPFDDLQMKTWYQENYFPLHLPVTQDPAKPFIELRAHFEQGESLFLDFVPPLPVVEPEIPVEEQPRPVQNVRDYVDVSSSRYGVDFSLENAAEQRFPKFNLSVEAKVPEVNVQKERFVVNEHEPEIEQDREPDSEPEDEPEPEERSPVIEEPVKKVEPRKVEPKTKAEDSGDWQTKKKKKRNRKKKKAVNQAALFFVGAESSDEERHDSPTRNIGQAPEPKVEAYQPRRPVAMDDFLPDHLSSRNVASKWDTPNRENANLRDIMDSQAHVTPVPEKRTPQRDVRNKKPKRQPEKKNTGKTRSLFEIMQEEEENQKRVQAKKASRPKGSSMASRLQGSSWKGNGSAASSLNQIMRDQKVTEQRREVRKQSASRLVSRSGSGSAWSGKSRVIPAAQPVRSNPVNSRRPAQPKQKTNDGDAERPALFFETPAEPQRVEKSEISSAKKESIPMSPEFRTWCRNELKSLTGKADMELVQFLMGLNSEADMKQYLKQYLGNTKDVEDFADRFVQHVMFERDESAIIVKVRKTSNEPNREEPAEKQLSKSARRRRRRAKKKQQQQQREDDDDSLFG